MIRHVAYRFGDWLVEPALNRVKRGPEERKLEPRAMNLLTYLLDRPDATVSAEEILNAVWAERVVEPNAVARTINQIRRALDDSPQNARYIETISRRGYRVIAPIESIDLTTSNLARAARVVPAPGSDSGRAGRLVLLAFIATGMLVAGALVRNSWHAQSDGPLLPRRFTIALPGYLRTLPYEFRPVAISPDASVVLFSSQVRGKRHLYARSLQSLNVHAIPGTEGAAPAITFSPDGRWIAFVDRRTNTLMKVAATGGIASPIGEVEQPVWGLSWSVDDQIVFETDGHPGLMRVPAAGGRPSALTFPEPGEFHKHPSFHPNGHVLFFTVGDRGTTTRSTDRVAALSLRSGKSNLLLEGSSSHATTDGQLIYFRDGGLWATTFQPKRMSVDTPGRRVIEDVHYDQAAHYSLSSDGTLVFVLPTKLLRRSLVWVDRRGNEQLVPIGEYPFLQPRISPDGARLAYVVDAEGGADLWVHYVEQETSTRLTFDESQEASPLWTPEGDHLIYSSNRVDDLFRVDIKSGKVDQLTASIKYQFATSISGSGDEVVISEFGSNHGHSGDIRLLSLHKDPEMSDVLATEFSEHAGVVSPDGRHIAYVSNRSGDMEIYVSPFPDLQRGVRRVSANGGRQPMWTRDGRELIYWGQTGMMSVEALATEDGELEFAAPKRLFDHSNFVPFGVRNYDVTPDGSRFLMVRSPRDEVFPSDRVVVVEAWASH